jgi:hypothetical protein
MLEGKIENLYFHFEPVGLLPPTQSVSEFIAS